MWSNMMNSWNSSDSVMIDLTGSVDAGEIALNVWHYIAVSYDSDTRRFQVYVNDKMAVDVTFKEYIELATGKGNDIAFYHV